MAQNLAMDIRPHPKKRYKSVVRFTDEAEYSWFQTNNPARITLAFSHLRYYWDTGLLFHREPFAVERTVRNRKLLRVGAYLGSEAVSGVLRDVDRDNPEFMTPAQDAVKARIALAINEYFEPMLKMAAARTQETPTE
ncbi:MAG TPA: hypothetical protein VLG13_03730 [Patescibacteria group bacterium]|nr:hypothetical protein [Patescibacteria group bacterium]